MGIFVREGAFRDRARFLESLRALVGRLREKEARGMSEAWERREDADVARLSGFGALMEFTVAESSWKCTVEIPPWLPIPQAALEAKFDEKVAELSGL